MTDDASKRYVKPGAMETFSNRMVGLLIRSGINLMGARVLAVKGRSSGVWRTTPVNLLTIDGVRYLVAPRGQSQWVRNIRAAGGGELRGRRAESITVTELPDPDKPPILRAYLARWGWQANKFFEGLTKDATDEQMLAAAPGFPVFRLT